MRTLGQLEEATAAFEKTHQLLRQLLAKNPRAVHLKANLAVCHANLGVLHGYRGEHRQALACYELARSIQQSLVAAEPRNVRVQYDLR